MQLLKITLVTLFFVGLGGCADRSQKLADGIREGQKQYTRGNYIGAERILSGAVATDPKSPEVAEAYYIRGLVRLKQLKHTTAGQDFRRALALTDRQDLRANAHVCLGSIAYEQQAWETAYREYLAAEPNLSDLSPSDWILFRLASSAQRSGRWEEGRKYFARILRDFPESETAKSARKNLKYWYFTVQVGAFASSAGAQIRMAELRRIGVSSIVRTMNTDGRTLHVVSIGRYNDYNQANKGLAKVRRVAPEARVVP